MAKLAEKGHAAGEVQAIAPKVNHLPAVDGLRALLALFVVIHHCFLTIWPTMYGKAPDPSAGKWLSWAVLGHHAVTAFIVVSGFCLTLPLIKRGFELKDGIKGFYLARARRILPPYYAAVALSLLLIAVAVGHKTGTHWDGSLNVTPPSVLAHLLMVHQVFGMADINHVFWSIGVEWWIYLLFPAILLLARRARIEVVAATLLAVSYPISYLISTRTPYGGATIHYVGIFGLGMLAAVWQTKMTNRTWQSVGLVALPPLAVAFWFCHGRTVLDQIQVMLAASIAVSLLLLASSPYPNVVKSVLGWAPLVRVGTFSYSVYLIHSPLVQLAWQVFCRPTQSALTQYGILLATSIPLVIAFSYAFFLAFERPFMSKRLRKSVEQEWVHQPA